MSVHRLPLSNLSVEVKRINNRWHARVLKNDSQILDEMACERREDIGWICREMLRWVDKNGFDADKFSESARKRKNEDSCQTLGKVWYQNQLKR